MRLHLDTTLSALCVAMILVGCESYEAPIADRGERQVSRAPIIVEGGDDAGQVIVDRSRASANTLVRAPNSQSVSRASSAPSSAAVSRGAGNQTASAHVVRDGETLYSIAYQYDLDFRALAIANNLRAPFTIFVGQELNLRVNQDAGSSGGSLVNSNLGTAVENNGIARTQGSSGRSGGVLRQAISSNASGVSSWVWPHSGRVLRNFRQGEGKGLDISGQLGEPVLAASDGDVVYAGRGVQGSGNLIILRHSDRYLSAYAHNSAMLVTEGQSVAGGQQIAELGEDSAGTPMLHFEIRLDGKSVDPATLLPSN